MLINRNYEISRVLFTTNNYRHRYYTINYKYFLCKKWPPPEGRLPALWLNGYFCFNMGMGVITLN